MLITICIYYIVSNPSAFSQKYDNIATITQRPLVGQVKDDEVSSSEEASVTTERTNVTDGKNTTF